MKTITANSGMRRHRPKKPFRFEYLKGKYTLMTTEDRFWRRFSEDEREERSYEQLYEELNALLIENEQEN